MKTKNPKKQKICSVSEWFIREALIMSFEDHYNDETAVYEDNLRALFFEDFLNELLSRKSLGVNGPQKIIGLYMEKSEIIYDEEELNESEPICIKEYDGRKVALINWGV